MTSTDPVTTYLELPSADLVDGKLVFGGRDSVDQALEIGAFFVAIPEHLDVRPGLDLCRNFYKPHRQGDRYRGHRTEQHAASKLGYADRPDQVEQLQIENLYWDRYFPTEVTVLLRQMESIMVDTLYAVFDAAGVPERDWETITGGAREGTAWCHSTLNHYRSNLRGRAGIVEHTDSGFITVLYPDQSGLEILRDGVWWPTEVRTGHFVVNMGDAAEILTRNLPQPVTAVVHRVPESPPDRAEGDRSSFTVFMGPRYDMVLYHYSGGSMLEEYQGFRDFSVEKARQLGYEFHPRL